MALTGSVHVNFSYLLFLIFFVIISLPDVSQKHETTRPITLFKDHATYGK